MPFSWSTYFTLAGEIQTVAERAGLPRRRARQLGERLAAAPLPREYARALLRQCGTPASPAVVEALRLLEQLEPEHAPPLAHVRMLRTSDPDAVCLSGTIFINPTSPLLDGPALNLAALLYHEQQHALHPEADEDTIRAAEQRFLERHS
jgi:hypothetical protein